MLHVTSDVAPVAFKSSAPPLEYLRLRQRADLAAAAVRWNRTFADKGIRFLVHDFAIVAYMSDSQRLASYLAPLGEEVVSNILANNSQSGRVLLDLLNHPLLTFAEHLRNEVISALPDAWRERLKDVPIGITPSHYWNAGAEFVPGGGDIITLNVGLQYLPAWNRYILRKGEGLDPDQEAINEMGRHAALITGYADVDHAEGEFAVHGFAAGALDELGDDEYLSFLYTTQISWVLLHEIMHVLRGHTDELRRNPHEVPKVEILRIMELEADTLTLPFLLPFAQSVGASPFAVIDALLFALRCIHFAEHLTHRPSTTHPPAADRIANMIDSFGSDELRAIVLERSGTEVFMAFGRPYFKMPLSTSEA
jgi:hypothetical protein